MKNKKPKGVESLKKRYGFLFTLPWLIGLTVFFIFPIIQSVIYSLSDLKIEPGHVAVTFQGFKHYHFILYEDSKYIENLLSGIKNIFIQVPFILVLSMVLGILLNNKFRGRVFFRSLYFLPVIITSGVVLRVFLQAAKGDATDVAVTEEVAFGMIDFSEVLKGLNLPESVLTFLSAALDNIFMLIWQSGIQIVLIIAGLQTIPDLLYEVAHVEGATKWEQFWFITLPMMIRTMLLVVIFTIVEVVTTNTNPVMNQGYNYFYNIEYGTGSAALWFYFVIVGVIIAAVFGVFSKMLKKWG
ncbi:MAG: sugar ABC transporter permease [Clostridia bacterium]|nr:sugar ABC transporter permease [Clostridia bacterium]